ncbi:hypothetical protein [Priestia megaterium]|uniref:hypothetical protein n=1 Tax=Priestia megaterium TaxID=1404 RepID=UPI002788DBC8|nr:hypothetical protein [Priestia megaterium]MDQ0808047.1 cell division septum initiation protein DivIVA [Priestia megaterium]
MTGILAYWFAVLVLWLIEHFNVSLVDVKAFMNGLPVGFWTVLGSLITAAVAMLTLVVTQVVNFHTQDRQAKNQNEALAKQLDHQKEMAQIQHFIDKRTEAVLEFQKSLEEARGVLEYFHSETADFERRRKLKVQYENPQASPKSKEDMIHIFFASDVENMLACALEQILPVEPKITALNNSLNLLVVYLDESEEAELSAIVKEIEYAAHFLIGNLKRLEEKKDPSDSTISTFVHIDEPSIIFMKRIRIKLKRVREILRNYLHFIK